MAEILITFVLSLVVIGALAWVMARGQTSRYQPTRADAVALLQSVLAGNAQRSQWDLFIGYPLYHDPELELFRLRCIALTEGDPDTDPMGSGIGGYLFNKAGREQLAAVLAELQQLIADEPYQQDF
ncbi:MAG: hypothetical protein V7707_01215 [Motiliproteus sp.]